MGLYTQVSRVWFTSNPNRSTVVFMSQFGSGPLRPELRVNFGVTWEGYSASLSQIHDSHVCIAKFIANLRRVLCGDGRGDAMGGSRSQEVGLPLCLVGSWNPCTLARRGACPMSCSNVNCTHHIVGIEKTSEFLFVTWKKVHNSPYLHRCSRPQSSLAPETPTSPQTSSTGLLSP